MYNKLKSIKINSSKLFDKSKSHKIIVKWSIQFLSYSLYFIAPAAFAQNTDASAIALFNSGQYQKAVVAFTALIKANKHDTNAYGYRGAARERIKDYDGARSDFRKLSRWSPRDPRPHFKLGFLWAETEDYFHSIREYTKAINLDPTYAVAYNNRGNSEYSVGEAREAMHDFTSAANADTTYPDPWYNRGHLKMALDDYHGAVSDFSRAIALDPSNPDSWFSRAQAYDAINDTFNAISDYSTTIQIDTGYMDAYYFRGCDLLEAKDYESAMNDFSASLSNDSSYYWVYYLRGTALDSLGEYAAAIDDYAHAIAMQRDCGPAYLGRGYAYLEQGMKDYACTDLNAALYYGAGGRTKELLDKNCGVRIKVYGR
jgi:tetratricopeptide (TPR) repeat protein